MNLGNNYAVALSQCWLEENVNAQGIGSQEIGRRFNHELYHEAWDLGPVIAYLVAHWDKVHPDVQALVKWYLGVKKEKFFTQYRLNKAEKEVIQEYLDNNNQ